MKKLIIATLAASILASPLLAAAHQVPTDHGRVTQRHDDHRRDQQRFGHAAKSQPAQYRGWRTGERFDRSRAHNYRVIDNPGHYRLRSAPNGYRWVQSGQDAVLIGITSGIVASVIANSIH